MDIEGLKKLKESNASYFISLLAEFDRYEPAELVNVLIKRPEAEEFVWDYINATSCHPAYRNEFKTELMKRKGDKRLETLAQTNSIENP